MKSRCVSAVAVLAVTLLFSLLSFAQEETKKMETAASLSGTSGLFKTFDAETLRQGEINFTMGIDMFHRDPGKMTIGLAPVGIAAGLVSDRLEFFESMDVQRYIHARNILTNDLAPGALPIPARTPIGVTYFNQIAPFMDVHEASDRSDFHLGVKFNILSERRGNAFSMGVTGFATLPGHRSSTGLSRGLSTGAYQAGGALLLSKTAVKNVRFHLNLGMDTSTNPVLNGVQLANLANEFIFRAGADMPVKKHIHFITEMNGVAYYGSSSPPGLSYQNPIDLIFGMRVFPREWFSFGAGYQLTLNHIPENDISQALPSGYHGFVVQGAFAKRRNDPPTVSCSVGTTIKQGETAKIKATAHDPDGDVLTYRWEATGGKIAGTGDTCIFDATGLKPGKYTVTATVKDKSHSANCTSDITVLKRNHEPTASIEPRTFDIEQGASVDFRCIGNDPDNDQLTYSWAIDGQKIPSTSSQITFGSEGRATGNHNVACTVSDGEATASARASGTVREKPKQQEKPIEKTQEKPNQDPTITCQTITVELWSGESKELRVNASDRDGDRLTYTWSGTGVKGSGDTARFNATGLKAGSYNVTATVEDGRGGRASCGIKVNVSERLSVTKDGKCGYFKTGAARVDNCAKAILDDLSVRLKNETQLRINIIGYTDSTEKVKKLGEQRAKAVEAYLEKKGVEKSRMTITDGGANNSVGDNKTLDGRKLNRRVEIEITVK